MVVLQQSCIVYCVKFAAVTRKKVQNFTVHAILTIREGIANVHAYMDIPQTWYYRTYYETRSAALTVHRYTYIKQQREILLCTTG